MMERVSYAGQIPSTIYKAPDVRPPRACLLCLIPSHASSSLSMPSLNLSLMASTLEGAAESGGLLFSLISPDVPCYN